MLAISSKIIAVSCFATSTVMFALLGVYFSVPSYVAVIVFSPSLLNVYSYWYVPVVSASTVTFSPLMLRLIVPGTAFPSSSVNVPVMSTASPYCASSIGVIVNVVSLALVNSSICFCSSSSFACRSAIVFSC